jgi:hypothetical protein
MQTKKPVVLMGELDLIRNRAFITILRGRVLEEGLLRG